MSCNCAPFIYTVNKDVSVAAGGNIPFGTVAHQKCDECRLNGNGIICKCKQVFKASINLTYVVPSASVSSVTDSKITLLQDGKEVQGAESTVTVDSATAKVQISFDTIVRNDTNVSSVLTVNTDQAIDVVNFATIIEPL